MSPKKKLKYYDLKRELKKGKTHPVYFFTREESLLKDKAFKRLKEILIPKKLEDFNFFVFYGTETDANTVLEQLDNPPVQIDKKLVIVKNFESMHYQHKKKILKYAKNPHDDNVLVLETGKVDMRKSIYKTLAKIARVYYFYHAYNEARAAKFVREEVRESDKRIAPSAVSLLVEYVGLDLLGLNNELQKLFLYTHTKNEIKLDDVEKCVGSVKGHTIFELQETLADKNLQRSLKILQNLVDNGLQEVWIVIMLTRFFKILWKTTFLIKKYGKTREAVASNLPYYNRKKYLRMAASYELEEIQRIFEILLDTDKKLKSLSINKIIIMDLMVYKICR
ncbi:MAG: DNA polymerase III subunit delta [Candidatus Cloacimonetes bacterium]|nr:DNA polymerase III subunit delta [Candidatus Cloacimonadota bacterium]MBS3767540.1 DNA polymerase III subunit delta [Candidatus Cloacimonadota bacterium]